MLIVHCSSEWASRPLHSTSNGCLKTCGPFKSSLIEYLKSCGLRTGCYTTIDMLNGFWLVRFDIVCMVFSLLISEMIMRITQRQIQVQAVEGCTEYEKSTPEKNWLKDKIFQRPVSISYGGSFSVCGLALRLDGLARSFLLLLVLWPSGHVRHSVIIWHSLSLARSLIHRNRRIMPPVAKIHLIIALCEIKMKY